MALDTRKYGDKWRDDSPDYPPCAECGKQIGSEDEDTVCAGEDTPPEVAIRVWRDHPDPRDAAAGEKQELAFHRACAMKNGLLEQL